MVASWQEIDIAMAFHILLNHLSELISDSVLSRWGWIKKMPNIALYESWKLISDGEEGVIQHIISALIDRELRPCFSLPSRAPVSYIQAISTALHIDGLAPVNIA